MNRNWNIPIDFGWLSYKSTISKNNTPKGVKNAIFNYLNEKNDMPPDFDWIAYRSLNPDLYNITSYKDAVKHYKVHGQNQSRRYKYETEIDKDLIFYNKDLVGLEPSLLNILPADFDWLAYRSLNADLSQITNIKDAAKHYRDHGQSQNRPYKFPDNCPQQIATECVNAEHDLINGNSANLTEFQESTLHYLNVNNSLPPDFDWATYRQLNPDLTQIKCYQDAAKHYKEYGINEQRQYKLDRPTNTNTNTMPSVPLPPPPSGFNWLAYKSLNSDLRHLQSFQEALKHYYEHGQKQNRPYQFPINLEDSHINPPSKISSDFDSLTYQTHKPSYQNDIKNLKLPDGFNWIAYKTLSPDLRNLNNWRDAAKHYLEHGYRQNRPYTFNPDIQRTHPQVIFPSMSPPEPHIKPTPTTSNHPPHQIPVDFDWKIYRDYNTDLKNIKTPKQAINHYLEHGYREQRIYKSSQAPIQPQTSRIAPAKPKPRPMPRTNAIIQPKPRQTSIIQPKPRQMPTQVPIVRASQQQKQYIVQEEFKNKKLNIFIKPKIPSDFEWNQYRTMNPDLKHIKNMSEAIKHYIDYGYKEGRLYKPAQEHIKNSALPYKIQFQPSQNSKIPNIIHFIYGFKKAEELKLFQYISIQSAIELNKPDQIYFYYKYEPYGHYWDMIKHKLILKYTDPPTEIFGNKVEHFAHQADIIRLKVLNEIGGIYFDIDTISLRSLKQFMDQDFVMGIQGDNYGLCNAIMMAKPNSHFGHEWHQSYRNFNCKNWDEHSVRLPLQLSKKNPHIPIKILPNDALFYPLWDDTCADILFGNTFNMSACHKIFQNSYCIHLWESFFMKHLELINERSLFIDNSLYNVISRKFLKNQFSIVMLTFNRTDKTIECISSFYSCLNRPDIVEFIIHDNHSDDPRLIAYLKSLPSINPKFRVIFSNENLGVCPGRIILFREAVGDIICSVDSDLSLINERFFDICKENLNDESIGMVGASGAYFSKSFRFQSHRDIIDSDQNIYVDQLAGCCQVFRKDLALYGVKLDPKYGKFWVEDADFCFQITNLGKKLLLIPQKNLVNHVWGGSGDGMGHLFKTNWDYFTSKWQNKPHLCSID